MTKDPSDMVTVTALNKEPVRACGLIMPISAIDGVTAEHWTEVRAIITEALQSIQEPKFTVRLVSDADETGIIQKRIVQNVYNSDIVVCDVSGKNPNVMFELGMRLAFDKSVVIVKDDKTDYSFDTGIIEHVTYPRDLRFNRIVSFKESLSAKVIATERASRQKDHSPFLKSFGSFHVASLTSTEVSPEKLTLEMLEEVRRELTRLSRRIDSVPRRPYVPDPTSHDLNSRILTYLIEHLSPDQLRDPSSITPDSEFVMDLEKTLLREGLMVSRKEFRAAVIENIDLLTRTYKSS